MIMSKVTFADARTLDREVVLRTSDRLMHLARFPHWAAPSESMRYSQPWRDTLRRIT